MHSEWPTAKWGETWVKRHYCKKKACQEQATFDALKGPEIKDIPTQEEVDKMMSDIRTLIQNKKNKKIMGS